MKKIIFFITAYFLCINVSAFLYIGDSKLCIIDYQNNRTCITNNETYTFNNQSYLLELHDKEVKNESASTVILRITIICFTILTSAILIFAIMTLIKQIWS